MELRQLEYFQMVSRLKNITRAAHRLRVSQPNITVAIKKLESELGVQLLDRSQKQSCIVFIFISIFNLHQNRTYCHKYQ